MINKAILVGNIWKIENRKTTNSQVTIVYLVTKEYKKSNESAAFTEETEWHTVVIFGELAEYVSNHFTKGDIVYVEGKIKTRTGESKDNKKIYFREIIVNRYGSIKKIVSSTKRKDVEQEEFGEEDSQDDKIDFMEEEDNNKTQNDEEETIF